MPKNSKKKNNSKANYIRNIKQNPNAKRLIKEEVEVSEADVVQPDDVVEVETVGEETLATKQPKTKKNKNDEVKNKDAKGFKKSSKLKPQKKERGRLKKKLKESVSELKKVSWPKFGKVVKTTGVVLSVVVIFTVVLFGIDYGFSWLYKLLTAKL